MLDSATVLALSEADAALGHPQGLYEHTTDDVAEVQSYVRATYRGLELIKTLPIGQRLVLEVHRLLLTGVRGEDRLPGELRRSPV